MAESAPVALAERPPPIPVTLVTGASEGLGVALAREFAAGGRDLVLVARSREGLQSTAEAIERDFGVNAHVCPADLTDSRACGRIERFLEQRNLYVEFLVNNAGFGMCGAFAECDPETLRRMIALNMRAPTDLIYRFLGDMLRRDAGGILNVGSLGGFLPGPFQAAYYASKTFLMSLTEALAHEVSGSRVRIAILTPGPVATRFHAAMGGEEGWYIRFQGLMRGEEVARLGYNNFLCGQRVIIPGLMNILTALCVRYIPHAALTPFAGWLYRPRGEEGGGTREGRPPEDLETENA
ncbi:MAG: SDR family oxidoreductase [Methyloligellaceae bacterium]